jgi:IS605 OrfB family transposase
LQIIEGRRRAQRACKYNQSKRGYDKKFQAMERFNLKEKRFAERKMHEYSKRLIDYCLKRNIGKIVLNNYQEVKDKTHEKTDEANFLLASWSYFSLSEKIKYKAAQLGIVLEII